MNGVSLNLGMTWGSKRLSPAPADVDSTEPYGELSPCNRIILYTFTNKHKGGGADELKDGP